jgi:hypothetical protein
MAWKLGMNANSGIVLAHPAGEVQKTKVSTLTTDGEAVTVIDTLGRRVRVEWDPAAAVTPMGQLVYFSQFLATAGLFADWVRTCPLQYTSPNAPAKQDVLGTILLSHLAGHHRYAHITALRCDKVNPVGLGMSRVCSEDSVRLAFKETDPAACAQWQQAALAQTWEPLLQEPWILDMDMTVKPIYGHQEGAELSYNPHKPGRPSHALHTWFIRKLRLVLDAEVRPGKQHAAKHGRSRLWALWDRWRPEWRPWLMCGDAGYGQEQLLLECEVRRQNYLFRQRQTRKVQQLIQQLMSTLTTRWVKTSRGWEGAEGQLRLQGWSRSRRVVVLRRRKTPAAGSARVLAETAAPSLPWTEVVAQAPEYEHIVLVTNLPHDLAGLTDLYLQRADAENVYDELKNQWGWGGFMTRDLHRCQVAVRNVALAYNWWSLFVRCAEPQRPREAITSRPLLLCGIGRLLESGHQLKVQLTSLHESAREVQQTLTGLSLFLSGLRNTAEQLTPRQCWERIWNRILEPFLTPTAALPAPSG